jgi:hypothetical protein
MISDRGPRICVDVVGRGERKCFEIQSDDPGAPGSHSKTN